MSALRAPFPYFGGKSRVAHLVWERFGDPANLVEPFAGSLAVLLGRPGWSASAGRFANGKHRTETVNDLDCYLANFWRAVSQDPDAVAHFADWPVNEADLHARHLWLVKQVEFRECMKTDPDFFDAKIAGWWVWGLCQWIGQGWCGAGAEWRTRPALGNAGNGVHRPSQQLPHLGNAGRGVLRPLPSLRGDSGASGTGIHSSAFERKTGGLYAYMGGLSDRLRHVRVACGDWRRVTGESVTVKHGVTAVLLDPPYGEAEHGVTYAAGTGSVAAELRAWALENGGNPLLRIALCGYAGEHDELQAAGWDAVRWKAAGGYGSQGNGRGRDNAARETVWFSPHCLQPDTPREMDIFATLGEP